MRRPSSTISAHPDPAGRLRVELQSVRPRHGYGTVPRGPRIRAGVAPSPHAAAAPAGLREHAIALGRRAGDVRLGFVPEGLRRESVTAA
jgi:hypothetical protein